MKPEAWNLDGFRFFSGKDTDEHLLVNQPIREFLDRIDKFFLIGSKGLGKTLFLRNKSFNYRTLYGDSIKFNVPLTENLDIHANTFTKEELLKYQNENLWSLIWQLALWTMVYRICREPINPKLDRIIDQATSLSPILARLLNHRKKISLYREFLTEYQDKRTKIKSGVMLFIDDIEQALHSLLRSYHSNDEYFESSSNPSFVIWINFQMGMVSAIYSISRQNMHIKIYTTIRREVFEGYDGELKINYEQHAVKLMYSKEEMKEIFIKNILLIEPSELVNKYSQNPFERFIGFDNISHGFARGENGDIRGENVFDFIYRHTYGRPREIIKMGLEIYRIVTGSYYAGLSKEDQIRVIRAKVNNESHDIFLQYRQEIIPYFSKEDLDNFVQSLHSNVIVKNDIPKLNKKTLTLYFNLGMIGYTRVGNDGVTLIQQFRPPGTYNYRIQDPLPDSDFFLVHPSLDSTLLNQHSFGHFYNKHNIIGNNYPFYPRVIEPIENRITKENIILIKGGGFKMGDSLNDNEFDNEIAHEVTLNDFYLAKNQTTFEEYDEFCKATNKDIPSDEGWGRGLHPVINISWFDALEYCNWHSEEENLQKVYFIDHLDVVADWNANGYRLPTEAEWEYAAREQGKNFRFGNGAKEANPKEINFNGNPVYKKAYSQIGPYRGRTVPVGSLNSPNSLGLNDMSGNVWEWCWDWYGEYESQAINPQGPDFGTHRIIRGGSWRFTPECIRNSYRGDSLPDVRTKSIGFRLARNA